MNAELLEAFRQIVRDELRQALPNPGDRLPRPVISRLDRERGAVLLPEISAAIGDDVFTCRALFARAVDVDLQLRSTLERVLGKLDEGACRPLGNLLARLNGQAVEVGDLRYCVERGEDHPRDGAVWSVVVRL